MVIFSLNAYLLELIESCTTFDYIGVDIAPLQGPARRLDDKHRGLRWVGMARREVRGHKLFGNSVEGRKKKRENKCHEKLKFASPAPADLFNLFINHT